MWKSLDFFNTATEYVKCFWASADILKCPARWDVISLLDILLNFLSPDKMSGENFKTPLPDISHISRTLLLNWRRWALDPFDCIMINFKRYPKTVQKKIILCDMIFSLKMCVCSYLQGCHITWCLLMPSSKELMICYTTFITVSFPTMWLRYSGRYRKRPLTTVL